MRIVKGWRKIDNKRGYTNATTGQNIVVMKKPHGEHFFVTLFPFSGNNNLDEGKKISPEYATESKAEAFALGWMDRHPKGAE